MKTPTPSEDLTEARWVYLNQVACEARQGHEGSMTLGVEEVIQLTKAAINSLRAISLPKGERPKRIDFHVGKDGSVTQPTRYEKALESYADQEHARAERLMGERDEAHRIIHEEQLCEKCGEHKSYKTKLISAKLKLEASTAKLRALEAQLAEIQQTVYGFMRDNSNLTGKLNQAKTAIETGIKMRSVWIGHKLAEDFIIQSADALAALSDNAELKAKREGE